MSNENNAQPPAAPAPGTGPQGIPFKKFKGQAELETGQAIEINCQALDHIAAMIKVAAILSDHPVAVRKWWMQEEIGNIITPAFTPRHSRR